MFSSWSLGFSMFVAVCPAVTPTMTVSMDDHQPEHCVECVPVRKVIHVIRCTASSTQLFRGVCLTLATVTITGLGCMEDLSGMDSSALPSLIRSQWANRLADQRTFVTSAVADFLGRPDYCADLT